MASTLSSVFRRRSLRSRRDLKYSYLNWLDEEEDSDVQDKTEVKSDAAKFLLCEGTDGIMQRGRCVNIEDQQETLCDCFYLGSYNMSDRAVKGHGCIDEPAAHIWEQTQNMATKGQLTAKQKSSSLPGNLKLHKPKYVRLAATRDELRIVDNQTEEVLVSFLFQGISFTGTHPKYSRLFCFIAWESKQRIPYCHTFKCESTKCASLASTLLSKAFQRKIRETCSDCSPRMKRPVLKKAMLQL